MKYIIILLFIVCVSCTNHVDSPVRIEEVYYDSTGATCWLRLASGKGDGVTWTNASPENCSYKKGDILK